MATDFWNGTGNWSTDDAAWSDNSPPISTEDAEIQTGTAILTAATAIAGLQVDAPATFQLTAGAALTDTGTAGVAGTVYLQNGATVSITGGLSLTGNALVEVDGTNIGGSGGSSLTIGGTLTNASTNGNGLNIGNSSLGANDTVTATALNNTGVIQITGNGTIQSTLDITTGAAGFGTLGVETGSVALTNDALLEFASGQIGTIDGFLGLNGSNARIADAGTLATNSALTGLTSIAGTVYLQNGASVGTTGGLSLIGNALVEVDGTNIGGSGGSSLTIGGTLTNASTNGNGLNIGNSSLGANDTVTATALNNTGVIQITGNGTIQSTLDITTGAAGFGTLGVETGSVALTNDALLEFASGQIGTIDGFLGLNGSNARIADVGTLATNSALTGLTSIAGTVYLQNGASVGTTGGLSLIGNALVEVDGTNIGGSGGSSLTIGGTLTNASTNGNGLNIGNSSLGANDTVTATALNNTGVIQITGNGTIQSTLDITTGAAGFGTLGVETGSVALTNDALLEFASGQIGTIDGFLGLNGSNARIADVGTLATNSALTGLTSIAGTVYLQNGASVGTTGGLSLIGNALVEIDGTNIGGSGGSSLTIGGTLTNASTNGNGLNIGNSSLGANDTVTATALNNTGVIQITGNGTIQSTLDITTGAAGFGTLGVETGSVALTNDALLEFASGQIGTIDGVLGLNGASARIADAGTLATNSALAGLKTVAGELVLYNGNSITTTGGLSVTGTGLIEIDGPNFGGGGGSSITIGGTLTNSSTNGNALDIGNNNIGAGDTVTATALNNTGVIQITGSGTIQSTLDITTAAAGFGTLGVETGSVALNNDALLEFASGQIGTIDGVLGLNGASARIADAGTLATNSALAGLKTVAGELVLYNGNSITTTGGLSVTGTGLIEIDGPNFGGGGGSSITIGGTLTNSSTNGNALDIGNVNIGAGDTVTAGGLNNTGLIQIVGNGTIVSALDINGAATNNASVNINGSGEVQMGAGDIYTQAADATNIAAGGTLAGTIDVTGGAVNIASGGMLVGTANVLGGSLDGTGTVVGTVNDTSGAVFAGPAIGTPGTLSVNGTYNQSGTGKLEANIGSGGTVSAVVADTGGFVNLSGGTLSVSSTPAIGSLLTVMTFGAGDLVGQFAAVQDGSAIGDGSNVNLGDGTTLEVFYNNDGGNIQIERVNNASLVANYTWTAATGDWSTASDWSGGQVPNSTANVVIGSTTTGNVTLDSASGDTTVNSLSILASNALTVSGVTLTSATGGSGIAVAAGASLSLSNGEIDGSVLSGAGLLQTSGGTSALAGDTISANTTFIGQNNTATELLGPIDNAGTIEQFGGNGQNGELDIADATTLTGGGTVTLSTNPTNGSSVIVQGNGQTLTNTNNSIQGNGFIGNGSLALVNGGVIDATTQGGSSTLTLNGSGGIINTGTLAAAAGAALVINTPVVVNAGGTILASAATSTVELVNATVQGGILNGSSKGTLETVSSAELDGSTHGALTITASSTYTASDNTTTYLLGSIVNDAQILLNGGNGQNGVLQIAAPVTLTGGGTIKMDTVSANGGEAIIQGNGQTLTNVNNTILGSGLIGNSTLVLTNEHVIDATPEGGSSTLTLNGSAVTNTDLLEATAGGVLAINGTTVDNAGGNITVSGATSAVQLVNTTVQGGTLNNTGGGTLDTVSTAELDGTTHGALTIGTGSTYTASDNTTTYLLGSIVNQGLIQLNGGNGQNGFLNIETSVTLSGGGTVTLSTNPTNGGSAFIQNNGVTLTNTNNTIQGTGVIGNSTLLLVNGGVVDATPEGGSQTLSLSGGGVTNTNLLEATAGGDLAIQTNVTNSAANIIATGSLSTVTVSNDATITGGTLNAVNGGALESTGNATLQGVTISALSTYTSNDNLTTTLMGTIDNLGTIVQIGGNGQNAFLAIGNAVTLTGSGTVLLDSIANSNGSAYVVGNSQTLTNSNNTIVGTGVIGNGNLVLINNAVIDATPEPGGDTTLTLNGGGVTNTSTMEASGGGVLVINTNVDNAGGNITTADATSTVQIGGATVEGGTLNDAAGGTFETVSNSTLDGSTQGTLTISSGSTVIATDNTTTFLMGTIDNLGALEQIGGNGQNGFLDIISAVTLTGGGTVTLDTIQNNGSNAYLIGNGETLTNTNNTIQGTGIIGNGSLMLLNEALIDATPEGGTATLTLNGGGITNTSTIEASAGGVLVISTTVDNAGGNITTADATSTVEINAATVEGGTLNNAAGGTFEIVSGSTLDGSTQGTLTISSGSTVIATDNTTTFLLGTIDNLGALEQIGGNGQNGALDIVNPVTLTGGGTVTLDTIPNNGGNAFLEGNGQTLTNKNNTIQGTGIIGNGNLALINQGLIDATPEGGTATLTLNGGLITNTSTMETSAGGVMVINTTVDNAGGNITTADANSAVEINAAAVEGGTLNNTAGGTFETVNGSTLDGSTQGALTISTGSSVTATDNTATTLLGTINNKGSLEQIGGNGQNGFLNIGGAVTLTGGGTVTLDTIATGGSNAYIQGNGETLTNTNNTIQGTGIIGNGNLALVNGGVIDATPEGGTSTLTLNNSGAFTSTGTLEATGGATLALDLGVITVSGLVLVAANSELDLTGELTVNGTLSNFGALSPIGGTEVAFGSGTDRLILGTAATFGGNVVGGGIHTTLELAAGSSAGTTSTLGTSFTNFGTVIVDAGATWTVVATPSVLATTTFIGDGAGSTLALTTAGTFSLGGVSDFGTVVLSTESSNNAVTVTDKTLSGGSVTINDTVNSNDTVSAAGDTSASKGKTLVYSAGSGTDSFTGGFENDIVSVSAVAVAGDTLTGGSGTNTLVLTSAGALNLSGASKFRTIDLAAGNNTVTVTDALLSVGSLTINDGASGNNTIGATSDTSASKGNTLTYNAGTGTDNFTGGFENDTVNVSAAAVGGDTLTGGSGANILTLTSAGIANLGGVSKFGTINLAAGNSTVTITDTTLSGGTLKLNDGASGNNTVSAAGDTSASKGKTLNYFTGPGTDNFTGGFENDTVHVSAAAVGGDVLTGGSGANALDLTTAGAVNLGGVSKFGTINLAALSSTVTITDTTLSGGTVVLNDGATGNDTVRAVSDTSASTGKILNYFTGTGTDSFTGGFENDTVHVSAALVGGDVLTAGSGVNTLDLTSAGTANLGRVSKFGKISLAAGNNTVTLTATTLSGGTVVLNDGTSGNDTVSAAGDTSASKGKVLNYFTGPGTDSFTGGFENATVHVSAAAVGSDTLTGGSGTNTLVLTSAGTVNLAGISKFGAVNLAAGNNTVTMTDTTLSGGSVTINDGASGNNTVSAAGDTSASKSKVLTYITGTGTDSFTGGFENDAVHVSAAAVGGDVLTGGSSGVNTLTLTTAGSANLGGVSKFQTIDLAAGNSTVTVTDTTLSGGAVTINDGASGNNTVSAVGDTSASAGKTLTYKAGKGADSFTGNFENDTVNVSAAAVGGDVLTGGSGVNILTLTSAGAVNLGGVSKFGTINLAALSSTVTMTDTTLSGGTVKLNDGASGNNTVSLAGDTSASKGKTLNYFTGSGTDSFTGGFENDTVHVAAAAVGGDVLTAGSGANALDLTSAGTANLGRVRNFRTINLAAGNSTVTLTDTTLSGGTVVLNDGTSGNNTVSTAGDTSASKGKVLDYFTGAGTDSFTGGFENDTLHVSAAAVGGDVLTGGSGTNALDLTSAGSANLGGVSKFGTINLAAGNNTVTLTDTTLSGGTVVLNDGASGNDTVTAAGDTSASKGKVLNYFTGPGTDSFTGGFENATVHVSAAAVGGDVLTGGSGTNTLVLTSAGTVNLGGVSRFGTINLAAGTNTATVTDTTLSGGSVTINAGSTGNDTISAAGDTAASKGTSLTYNAGSGTNGFTGGFENDTIYAGTGSGSFTAGSGSDTFVFIKSNLPNQTLNNFQVSADDILVYGTHASGGFNLGSTDNPLNPTTPTAIDPSIFVANVSGDFTSSSQRFAYDTSNGQLFYSATGSNSSESLIATLTGEPHITAGNLLFEH